MKELVYEAPQVEMVEVNVENGFAVSSAAPNLPVRWTDWLDDDDEIY